MYCAWLLLQVQTNEIADFIVSVGRLYFVHSNYDTRNLFLYVQIHDLLNNQSRIEAQQIYLNYNSSTILEICGEMKFDFHLSSYRSNTDNERSDRLMFGKVIE